MRKTVVTIPVGRHTGRPCNYKSKQETAHPEEKARSVQYIMYSCYVVFLNDSSKNLSLQADEYKSKVGVFFKQFLCFGAKARAEKYI
jgi:hypothetical protein